MNIKKMEESDQKKLKEVVIEHSQGTTWDKAKKEWFLFTIYEEKSNCVCGHFIVENCLIQNKLNKKMLVVGNSCINHFQESWLVVPSNCFSSLKKLLSGGHHASDGLIGLAVDLGILNSQEAKFYKKITSGKGSRSHFDPDHDDYSEKKTKLKNHFERLIMYGFRPAPCCRCKVHMKVRSKKNEGGSFSYFYGCSLYPKGCRQTITVK
jgi:hypothetical protein